ncbi:MAG: di-heme enzyme [Kofleriaceae bacterium]|nr:di-heme enzyme [Kofleriaceae bacterium]
MRSRLLLGAYVLAGCGEPADMPADAGAIDAIELDAAPDAWVDTYPWNLPLGFPTPIVPATNPMSEVKVELGRRLFYDTRMSGNQTFSCASCHEQAKAFTDGAAVAVGSTGELHPRNSMSLTNVAYLGRFTWANHLLAELETQAVVPIFGDMPVELGLRNMENVLLARLAAEPIYPPLFAEAFPDEATPISVQNVAKALAAFQRTLISANSPFDRYQRGDANAISESAKRGKALFDSEKAECFHCHQGFNFQDVVRYVGKPNAEVRFHNTGLYNLGGTGAYPANNTGLHGLTLNPSDMGKFRAPTLRNIAVTAPYFHDGSAATLDDVIDHYAAGRRTIETGPNAGVGSANPYKSSFIIGFTLTAQERADLKAFLESLTDDEFLTAPRFANPW